MEKWRDNASKMVREVRGRVEGLRWRVEEGRRGKGKGIVSVGCEKGRGRHN